MYALSLDHLNKTYANGVTAVRDVCLQVKEGEFFALLGPNGTGKSTIINIISSLVNKSSGTVKIFDYDIERHPVEAKQVLGVVAQEINFNQFETVLDIVINQAGFYGIKRQLALERAEKYLSLLSLWEKRHAISRSLSGGMKRRLMIAKALMHEPKLLLLDEPTTGIDVELRLSTWDFLQTLNTNGVTIILTTHYLEEAERLCHGLGIMRKGVLLEKTTMKEFLARLTKETLIVEAKFTKAGLYNAQLDKYAINIINDHSFELTIAKKDPLNQLFSDFSSAGIEVSGLRHKTNPLEELFLATIKDGVPK
jgi:ABC-2 type transport system ATP-binding protein